MPLAHSGRPVRPCGRGLPDQRGASILVLPWGLGRMWPSHWPGQAGFRGPVLPGRVAGVVPVDDLPGMLGEACGPVRSCLTLSPAALHLWVSAGCWWVAEVQGELSGIAASLAAPWFCAAGPGEGGRALAGQQVRGAHGGS